MKKNVKVTNVSDDEEEEKIQINFFLLLSFLHSRGQWVGHVCRILILPFSHIFNKWLL